MRVAVSTRAVTFGQPVTVSVRALQGGAGAAGVRVTLERSTGAGWTTVRTGTSGPGGLLSWTLRPDRGGVHRARVQGALSGVARVDVRPRVTMSAGGGAITGRVAPGGRVSVLLERRTAAGWMRHQSLVTGTGAYRFVPRLPRATVLRVVVRPRPGLLPVTVRPFRLT